MKGGGPTKEELIEYVHFFLQPDYNSTLVKYDVTRGCYYRTRDKRHYGRYMRDGRKPVTY